MKLLGLTGREAARYLASQFCTDGEQRRWAPALGLLRADPDGRSLRNWLLPGGWPGTALQVQQPRQVTVLVS